MNQIWLFLHSTSWGEEKRVPIRFGFLHHMDLHISTFSHIISYQYKYIRVLLVRICYVCEKKKKHEEEEGEVKLQRSDTDPRPNFQRSIRDTDSYSITSKSAIVQERMKLEARSGEEKGGLGTEREREIRSGTIVITIKDTKVFLQKRKEKKDKEKENPTWLALLFCLISFSFSFPCLLQSCIFFFLLFLIILLCEKRNISISSSERTVEEPIASFRRGGARLGRGWGISTMILELLVEERETENSRSAQLINSASC